MGVAHAMQLRAAGASEALAAPETSANSGKWRATGSSSDRLALFHQLHVPPTDVIRLGHRRDGKDGVKRNGSGPEVGITLPNAP